MITKSDAGEGEGKPESIGDGADTNAHSGGEALLRGLLASGVNHCFMNPGTSEMHLVAALDRVPEMRGILGLFEGVVTGAADGYGRMAGKPAASLLHLGPGLGNGIANLHNARRAYTPVVNIVGDHATEHLDYDPPLACDIEGLAMPVSIWYRKSHSARHLAGDAAAAVKAACGPPSGVATLVVPAELTWSVVKDQARACEDSAHERTVQGESSSEFESGVAELVAKLIASGQPTAILLGGRGLGSQGIRAAVSIASAIGARVLCETFPARIERGGGIPELERLGYLPEHALSQLSGLKHLVLAGAVPPVSFFKYPNLPSSLVAPGCEVYRLAGPQEDVVGALEALAEIVCGGRPGRGANGNSAKNVASFTGDASSAGAEIATGALNAQTIAAVIGALLPEGAIVSDESNTSGIFLASATAGAPRHHWLSLTGGAIGQGMPVATGAALACPGRKVLSLEADGSAMYTLQALWTQARESLDVTTVVFDNQSYAILNFELARVGAGGPGELAREMLSIAGPSIDFVSLAKGMGVPAKRVDDVRSFAAELAGALSEDGPKLIHAVMS